MNWYCLTVSEEEVVTGKARQFTEAFAEAFAAAKGPRVMALFRREREEGGIDLFCTPDCGNHVAKLLEDWHCTSCERPSLMGLQLLVGHNEITYYMP